MVQTAQDVDFLFEGIYPLFVLQKLVSVILLDRHLIMGTLNSSALYCAESSLAYQNLDVVVFEGGQIRTIESYGTHVAVGRTPMPLILLMQIRIGFITPFGACSLETRTPFLGSTELNLVVHRASRFPDWLSS